MSQVKDGRISGDVRAALFFSESGGILFEEYNGQNTVSKPLSPVAIKRIFSEQMVADTGWMTGYTIRRQERSDETSIAKYFPSKHYDLAVEYGGSVLRLRVPMPGLIFAGNNRSYSCFAVKSTSPGPDTETFRAPLTNVDLNGAICFGNLTAPICSNEGIDEAFSLFIGSLFNDHHANGKSRENPDNIIAVLDTLHRNQAGEYPADDLVPYGTLEDALSTVFWR